MDFVAIDFETANDRRDSACALGIAIVSSGTIAEEHHFLIRPLEMQFLHRNIRIHGITPERVADSPTFKELWATISPILTSAPLVAHNAAFDMSVLRHTLHSSAIDTPQLEYACSWKLSKIVWPELQSHRLNCLAEFHNIELDHHNAGSDAKAAAELILLAAKTLRVDTFDQVFENAGMSIGQVTSFDQWAPSSAPRQKSGVEDIEIDIPEGYDLSSNPLYDKNVVFTGALTSFTRKAAERATTTLGGHPKSSVSKKTDYVIVGVQDPRHFAAGANEYTKSRRARELRDEGYDIEILTESEFAAMVFAPSRD
jgi:DNA polymerase-3 subunit epsilon